MPRWSSKREYGHIQAEIHNRSGLEFQRYALSLLRVDGSELHETTPLGLLDKNGVDHIALGKGPVFPLVVQCKGFRVAEHELGQKQIESCTHSIRKFLRSGLKADHYVLAINRIAKASTFRLPILASLQELRDASVASTAELWNRQRLGTHAFDAMVQRCVRLLDSIAIGYYDSLRSIGHFGPDTINVIPFGTSVLEVDQARLRSIGEYEECFEDPCDLLSREREKLALILGDAGSGKTTLAFRFAHQTGRTATYVPAARVSKSATNTKDFLRQILSTAALLEESLDEDRSVHKTIAFGALTESLRRPISNHSLVIDGLDESVYFARIGGLQELVNIVADTEIPSILTCRSEFWQRKSSEFLVPFGIPSSKPNFKFKRIRIYYLLPWGTEDIAKYLLSVLDKCDDPAHERRIQLLRKSVEQRTHLKMYGEMLNRPLFLRMVVETLRTRDPHQVSRSMLFDEWVRQKIERDVFMPIIAGGKRVEIAEGVLSIQSTIEISFHAMECAAALMTRVVNGELELLPTCSFRALIESSDRLRGIADVMQLVLNSVLVPRTHDDFDDPGVAFCHRAFQEFFLSRALRRRTEFLGVRTPHELTSWLSELQTREQ